MVPMECSWALLLLLLFLTPLFSAAVAFLFSAVFPRRTLPPGPAGLPFIGNHSLLGKTIGAIGPTFHRLREGYSPYITLHIGGRHFIFISDHASAHRALVAAGATFADRPPFSDPWYTGIFASGHGPAWRLLRCNITSEVLHPTRYKSYTSARAWALRNLLGKLAAKSEAAGCVRVRQSFQHTMFSQFILICFGEKKEEERLREVRRVHKEVLMRVVCWVNPTLVLGEANDLYISFGKTLLLELAFGVREVHESLWSLYCPVTNGIRAQVILAVTWLAPKLESSETSL